METDLEIVIGFHLWSSQVSLTDIHLSSLSVVHPNRESELQKNLPFVIPGALPGSRETREGSEMEMCFPGSDFFIPDPA